MDRQSQLGTEFIDIANKHHEKMQISKSMDDCIKMSQKKQRPIENVPKTKKINKEFKKIAKKIIILSVMGGLGLGVGGTLAAQKGINEVKIGSESQRIEHAVAKSTIDNTIRYGYNPNTGELNFNYDINGLSNAILNNNQEYSIDYRIYNCNKNLQEYQKTEYMDSICRDLKNKVQNNLELYDENVRNACNFDSFADYIASKNMTEEEYMELMKKIERAYAQENLSQNNLNDRQANVNELLSELNNKGVAR